MNFAIVLPSVAFILLFGFLFAKLNGRPSLAGTLAGIGVVVAFLTYFLIHEPPGRGLESFLFVSPILAGPAPIAFGIGYVGATLGLRKFNAPSKGFGTPLPLEDKTPSLTFQAGRLIRANGWITLAFTIAIGIMLVAGAMGGTSISLELWAIEAGMFCVTACYLYVGENLKKHRAWARPAGVVLAILSLANFPIGAILGVMALANLAKGWNETSAVATST